MYFKLISGNNQMFSKRAVLVFRDEDGSSKWFRFRNVNKWIHKFWKPSFIGMYVGKYEGEWKDGQMHGKGTLRISRIFRRYMGLGLVAFGWRLIDQGEYVGEWKNGKEHGKGIRFFRDGLMNNDNGRYEGEWKNGLEHGHGTKTWPDGRKFIGKWKKGKYFHGKYYFANGDKHFGFFKDGLATGIGTRIYSDGRKYKGKFECARWHGQGTYYPSCGGKLVGRFKGGIPWNTTDFDEDKNFIGLHVRGVEREIMPLKPNHPLFIN